MKQTAVEWLFDQINDALIDFTEGKISASIYGIRVTEYKHQAKAMEKEQIMDAFGVGCQVESTRLIGYHGMAEQYYNENFKSE